MSLNKQSESRLSSTFSHNAAWLVREINSKTHQAEQNARLRSDPTWTAGMSTSLYANSQSDTEDFLLSCCIRYNSLTQTHLAEGWMRHHANITFSLSTREKADLDSAAQILCTDDYLGCVWRRDSSRRLGEDRSFSWQPNKEQSLHIRNGSGPKKKEFQGTVFQNWKMIASIYLKRVDVESFFKNNNFT